MNIATLLQMTADAFGDRIAITDGTTKLSYAEWYAAAERAADYFREIDCKYVAALDVYTPALPVALYGAAIAGIPYVPINFRLTNPEIDALLERVPGYYLITSADRVAKYAAGRSNAVIDCEAFLKNMINAAALEHEPARMEETDPAQVAVQLFTSGTTGTPKAAVLRHKNIVSYVLGSVEFGCAGEDDAVLVSVPPYHIAGISAVISAVFACRRVVLLPSFDAATWLELARKEHVSNAFLVPTMLVRIVDHLESTGTSPELPALRAIAYGGGKMPETVIRRALELFPNVDFTNAYGLTETSSTITVLGPAEHRAALLQSDRPEVVRRLTSVGVALPGVEIQIRDADGNVQPPNQPGEIYVRGEQVSGEYVGKGSLLDADGWFPTRDAGSFDEEGYLFLEGRADDVIVRGGENISPGEIEDVLMSHAAVLDAAVVGIPSEQWGEAVAAAVQLKTNASVTVVELQELVRQRLRSSRIPEHISFFESLPYNETGKLLRRTVKQQLTAVVVK